MSFVYLPVQVEGSSEASYSDIELFVMSRTTPIVSKSSKHELGMASTTMPQSGMTLEHSTGDLGVDAWILSLRDSLANRSALPVSDKAPMTSVTCGPKHSVSLGKYDPDTHSLRTSQGLLALDTLEPSCVTLPRAGTMRSGVVWERTMSAHRIEENGCGYWPTPAVQPSQRKLVDGQNISKTTGEKWGISLVQAVKMWPTPQAHEGRLGYQRRTPEGKGTQQSLSTIVRDREAESPGGTPTRRTYPTPRGGGKTGDVGMCGGTGAYEQIQALDVPENEKKAMAHGKGGQLSPDWVEWLMGWPIGLTDLKPLAMDRFQEWLRRHGGCCEEK